MHPSRELVKIYERFQTVSLHKNPFQSTLISTATHAMQEVKDMMKKSGIVIAVAIMVVGLTAVVALGATYVPGNAGSTTLRLRARRRPSHGAGVA
jgi:hypothetical protein